MLHEHTKGTKALPEATSDDSLFISCIYCILIFLYVAGFFVFFFIGWNTLKGFHSVVKDFDFHSERQEVHLGNLQNKKVHRYC